jgi:hypothetical protein
VGALPHSYSYSHKALFYFNLFLALNLTRYLLLTLTPNLLLGFFTSYSYSYSYLGSFLTSIPTLTVSGGSLRYAESPPRPTYLSSYSEILLS